MFAAVLGCAGLAGAQELHTYVGVAFGVSSWDVQNVDGGTPNLTFRNTSDTTNTIVTTGEAGRFLTAHFAFGAEIGQTSRGELTQTHGYLNPYLRVSRVRDLTFFGLARYQIGTGWIRGAVVGGAGPVQQSSVERTAEATNFPSLTFGPFGPEREVTEWAWGGMAGAELIIRVARHVSVVPQLRVVGIARGDVTNFTFASYGLNTSVYRAGVGVRAAF